MDPDNRRPVAYDARIRWLRELDERIAAGQGGLGRLAGEPARDLADPRAKLFVAAMALRSPGPLTGIRTRWICSTADSGRACGSRVRLPAPAEAAAAVVIVPRLTVGLVQEAGRLPIGRDIWGDTPVSLPEELAGARWRNVFTGETLAAPGGQLGLAEVLCDFPVALLLNV